MKNRVKFTREQIHDLCPECAKDMKKSGIKSVMLECEDIGVGEVTASFLAADNEEVHVHAGFSPGLCKKFGPAEGFFTRCEKGMGGKVDDSKAFCASLHKFCVGKWPSENELDDDAEDFDQKLIELEHSNVIRGIEIFAAGKHNNQDFTEKDLDDIVDAFGKLDFKPALKIGHSKHEKGQPAFGWVTNLKKVGTKLVADFESMHDSVVEAVRKKMFDRVSSEIYFNLERSGQTFRRALRAVALLGVEVPAVAKLTPLHKIEFDAEGEVQPFDVKLDVPAQASIDSLEARVSGITNFLQESVTMAKKNAAKITELKEKVTQFRGDMDKLKKKGKDDDDEEMKRLKKMADDIQSEIVKLEAEKDDDDVLKAELEKRDKRIAQLEADRRRDQVAKMTEKVKVPALRPAFSALYEYGLEHDDVKVAVFSKDKDGKDVKEEKSLVGVADGIAGEINRQAERLFSALATQKGGKLAEREEGEEDDRPVDVIVDEKVQKLQREKPTEYKDYDKAMKFVLDSEPELKEKFVASFSH